MQIQQYITLTGSVAYTAFHYDASGNLSRWQSYSRSMSSADWFSFGENAATYHAGPNPYNISGLNYYITRGEVRSLSGSLMQKLVMPFGITDQYSYMFFSNGLPAKLTIDNGPGPDVIVSYFYE